MKFKEVVEKIEKGKNFKDFKKKNSKAYLIACFSIDGEKWQVNYFNPESKKVSIFENGKVSEDKVFQKEKEDVKKLEIDKVKTGLEEVLKEVEKLISEKYKGAGVVKKIIILQTIEDIPTWNITYLTDDMHILNVKIDAETKEIIEEKYESIMGFRESS